jgi:hypothetical protein
MSKRGGHFSGAVLLVVVCVLSRPQPVAAQLDFIQGLVGRPRPALRAAFQGHEQLSLALEQADKGDIEGSLKAARAAFADRGSKELFNDLDVQTVGPNVLRLSNLWSPDLARRRFADTTCRSNLHISSTDSTDCGCQSIDAAKRAHPGTGKCRG